jgi:MFS family permease
MFDSFRIHSFRFQWSADTFATWAAEMETLVLGWYVLVDTDSPFLVGLVGALRFGGTLLAPLYGVVADRMDRRLLLMLLRLIHALFAAAFMALALAGALEPWHAFAVSAAGGLVRMGENVVRQSLIADIVPPPALMNAVSLSRTTMDSAKIGGSLAGAALLAQFGLGWAYVVVTACYVLSALLALGITARERTRQHTEGPLANLRAGVVYMRRDSTIVAIMFLAFLVNLTVFPLTNGLMPVVARDVFGLGPGGLAALLAAASAGALAGSLALAALSRMRRPERTMALSIVAWHLLLLVFTRVESLPVALGVLALYGAVTSSSMITMSAVLLATAQVEFRGRVMGVRMMAVYGLPVGLMLGGYLSERFGVEAALTALGVLGLALTAAAMLVWPSLVSRRLDRPLRPVAAALPGKGQNVARAPLAPETISS